MSITKTAAAEIVSTFGSKPGDSGSTQVQIALLTHRLTTLNEHFKKHSKDNHSRYGLLKLVGQRRRLLRYLQNSDAHSYKDLIGKLGIRK